MVGFPKSKCQILHQIFTVWQPNEICKVVMVPAATKQLWSRQLESSSNTKLANNNFMAAKGSIICHSKPVTRYSIWNTHNQLQAHSHKVPKPMQD